MLQRYQNVRNELEIQQGIEQMKYERQARNSTFYSDERQTTAGSNRTAKSTK